jgi:hypothetical protein
MGSYITFEVNGEPYALAFGARRGIAELGSASDLAAEYGGGAGAAGGLIGDVIAVALSRRAARLGRQWFGLLSDRP